MSPIVIGIFVGGAGKRMGGLPKGLLKAPDSADTLLGRLIAVSKRAVPSATLYLVGQAPAYAAFGLPCLFDHPADVGPIGGLRSLLVRADAEGAPTALALACDLPFLDEAAIALLASPLTSAARVPVAGGRLQPLAAAYSPVPALAAVERALSVEKHALMAVLECLGAAVERVGFDETRAHVLTDWDTPEDVQTP